ncbi:cupin domain-containing protein [Hazenella sp. IB182357]|uniref:Cupin domain-containing protein n=1 Tax=Polycladospora coralii TaxID=2771432 RepID=A0A926NFV2_9BACL|nr:cupin domain-containing protein [Polycladospora coralii]MBD1372558.1 cupin domain-containing protein [Polycladospora coralii]MBS7531319.1 cupin domain-containing protein [Polycladospora coralii]
MKMNKKIAPHYKWGTDCDGWLLADHPAFSVIEERMPAHTKEVRHYHTNARQFFYILSGTATLEVEGKYIELSPQDGIEIAPLTIHQMMNRTDHELSFILFSSPSTRGDRKVSPKNNLL